MTGVHADNSQKTHGTRCGVVVIGSANIDVSMTTATLPHPGETVAADSVTISVGGKGANQAVAAASCGAATEFVARIGADAFGGMVCEALTARGVGTTHVQPARDASTGLAAIYVDRKGQNCIVVAAGANASLGTSEVTHALPLLQSAAVVVLQCESPLATVCQVIELAAQHGTPVILNPAPCQHLKLDQLPSGITYLIPNESEAAALAGRPVMNIDDAHQCAAALRTKGIECVIITLGADGCVLADDAGTRHFPAHPIVPVDTTGAGDAFIGCFAAALADGRSRAESISRACLYASLSIARPGAQQAYPTAAEFERAWEHVSHGLEI